MKLIKYTALLVCLGLGLVACRESSPTPILPDQTAEQPATPAPTRALTASCIYTEGLVELQRADRWLELDIGDAIQAGDTLRTGPDGSCEIRFGATAVLRLQLGTTLTINEILLSEASSRIDTSLDLGALLTKVQHLAGADSYTIRTETSVCGVRGTEFGVSSDPEKGTTIAVSTGRVAVLPASDIVNSLLQEASTNAVAAAAIQAIVASAAIVEPDQEVVMNAEMVADAAVVYEAIAEAVASVPAEPIAVSAESASVDVIAVAPPLLTFQAPPELPVVAASAQSAQGSAASAAPGSQAAPGSLAINPTMSAAAQAAIARVIQRVNTERQVLTAVPVRATAASRENLRQLEAVSAVPDPQSMVDTPSNVSMVSPATVATPTASQPDNGTPATPADSANAASRPVTTPAATTPAPTVTTPATPAPSARPSALQTGWATLTRSATGSLIHMAGTGMMITSDIEGTVSGINANGRVVWTIATRNRAAERSYPVPFKANVYYSGSGEFVIVEAATGRIVHRSELSGDRSHMFGNRIVPVANAVLFPTRTGLEVISETGEVLRTITVPGGTNMTPANYRGQAAIVNQRGVFLLLNVETGEAVASIQTNAQQPMALAARIMGDRAVFADRKGLVVMVDLATRAVVWERMLGDAGGIHNDLEYGRVGVFAYARNTIYSMNPAGAELMPPVSGVSAPPLLVGGILYYGTTAKRLVAYDVANRRELAIQELPAALSARPLLVDGVLYGSLADGSLMKVTIARFHQ
ncbi:MAG: hypothetical protein A2087_03860 [Spirochaetes bacterium GWD1_61_31]|nr:MAG: hypothetical protein A2Y37_05100 [Spirochaetes bacterium GWB1_60_80]OHD32468.1 MAG: hypothetical protein A2004_12080 [Spirochaetes bacterium GWC1_61_12]OHD42710.1 MAG: hypothetical protein A2087_03860 [Spirochaetes bacterium GWD1_61_31]OHD43751.1 MAG: hypothetical protein A2Y35_00290 [Spirochaetes bacterium GWE1_60_18]OHD60237.1 MAG: hypothetical protein A2Y32_07340 [Spirochaetes bacterium GWF1_60_12]HAP44361.1 hypothetical protein [Spirochaetaceae bacterium]